MNVNDLAERILRIIEPYEFRSFVLGFHREAGEDRAEHERKFRTLKRTLGEELTRRLPGVDADFVRPDLRIDVAQDDSLRVRSAPIFIGGRYRKLSREIPATRWIHHACHGKGCPVCSHTGNLCGPSVQELMAAPALRASGGQSTRFHGLGREDVDARMLGRGRPFVLEVHHPLRRTLPLDRIREEFHRAADGLAEICDLALSGPQSRTLVKAAEAEKSYRAWLDSSGEVDSGAVRSIEALAGVTIEQLSPSRVQHRRGRDTVRRKRIIESTWIGEIDGRQAWELRVDAGTYVKELVSGDGGRTRPSLAEVLGRPCRCVALDVLEIHWEPPWERVSGETTGSPGPGVEIAPPAK